MIRLSTLCAGAVASLAILAFAFRPFAAAQHTAESRPALPPADQIAKLPRDGGPEFNRLVFEKSPYLLQHARNPVDWYPWGEEAFEKANKEDKPIFLSIGYSTCHWCHVMEHESFENPDVAKLLNEHFVCIKVDREERPDVDNIYMTACQAMTGSGGWPLTIVMTPDKKPFFAGTYFPKEARFGRAGMLDLVPQLASAWRTRRDEVITSADRVTSHLQGVSATAAADELGAQTLTAAFRQLSSRFDEGRGGFGEQGTKFPVPHNLTFLLRYWKRTGDERALQMVEKTLQAMRNGGIYDHIGFGFHRYATDPDWLVPHFEKMLYDQALLVIAYIEAYQATGNAEYAQTARETLTYVLRDLTSPGGGFYSAEDADSEGVEGKFYLWRLDEVQAALSSEDAQLFAGMHGLKPDGNFQNPHTPPRTNIPHRTKPLATHAADHKVELDELNRRLEAARSRLFELREKRVHPHKDDKILTNWNGLMIAALARAAQVLDEPRYASAAQRAADFVLAKLRDKNGRLLKRYRDGEAGLPAHQDDYAFFTWGLLDLYEANFEVRNLTIALELNRSLIARFWDDKHGGLFFTAHDGEALIARTKEIYDGALPSGNSVAMMNLLRLSRITADPDLEKKAAAIGAVFSAQVAQAPSAHTQLLCAIDFAVGPSFEVVIASNPGAADTAAMLRPLRRTFVPNKIVIMRPNEPEPPPIVKLASFTAFQLPLDGRATAYVCRNYACETPTTEPSQMLRSLKFQP